MEFTFHRNIGIDKTYQILFTTTRCLGPMAVPSSGSIDVYGLNLDARSGALDSFEEVLSPRERIDVDRFALPGQRRRVAVSRGALRWILSRYLGRAPAEIPLARTRFGKPFVEPPVLGEYQGLQVSCSRSGPYTVIAVAHGQSVGVDIEVVNTDNFSDEVADIMLSRPERDQYGMLPHNTRNVWLARTWVAKEAILKGIGCGMQIHPASVNVSTPTAGEMGVLGWISRAAAFSPWWLCESAWGPCVVALATQGKPTSLRILGLTPDF